jgi:hypothetical protein
LFAFYTDLAKKVMKVSKNGKLEQTLMADILEVKEQPQSDQVKNCQVKLLHYDKCSFETVDCVGASKGLFCGLLLLVTALICLILFFVLVEGKQLKWLAIYLADCSHAGLLLLSFLATLIGFIR